MQISGISDVYRSSSNETNTLELPRLFGISVWLACGNIPHFTVHTLRYALSMYSRACENVRRPFVPVRRDTSSRFKQNPSVNREIAFEIPWLGPCVDCRIVRRIRVRRNCSQSRSECQQRSADAAISFMRVYVLCSSTHAIIIPELIIPLGTSQRMHE